MTVFSFAVVLVLAIIVMIAVRKLHKPKKGFVRGIAGITIVVMLMTTVWNICTGPMNTMMELISATSNLSDETTAEATALVTEISEEGILYDHKLQHRTKIVALFILKNVVWRAHLLAHICAMWHIRHNMTLKNRLYK